MNKSTIALYISASLIAVGSIFSYFRRDDTKVGYVANSSELEEMAEQGADELPLSEGQSQQDKPISYHNSLADLVRGYVLLMQQTGYQTQTTQVESFYRPSGMSDDGLRDLFDQDCKKLCIYLEDETDLITKVEEKEQLEWYHEDGDGGLYLIKCSRETDWILRRKDGDILTSSGCDADEWSQKEKRFTTTMSSIKQFLQSIPLDDL